MPSQMAMLVPAFDPSKDDMTMYQQKVEMLCQVWPPKKMPELVTRLILSTTGSAFQKLQLHHAELCTHQDTKGVQQLISILGGHWGRIALERRFEDIERALYQCGQVQDETPDSYLARADVMWSKLKARKLDLEEVQAFVVLKGAALTSEDKKRVILDADSSLEGALTYKRVAEAVRLLGAGFFQDMTGARKNAKTKVYTQETLSFVTEATNLEDASENPTMVMEDEDEILEALLAEGDEDAAYVADYESAIMDLVQNDPDIGSAYSVYTEARKRLTEKFKARGFFPSHGSSKGNQNWSKGKGYGGGYKGKSKGKGQRRSLQARIMETYCKNCWRKGHWKAECPYPAASPSGTGSTSSSNPTAPTSYVMVEAGKTETEVLPLEFLQLPEVSAETTLDEPPPQKEESSFWVEDIDREYLQVLNRVTRQRYSGETIGDNNLSKYRPQCRDLRNDCSESMSDRRKSAVDQASMTLAPTARNQISQKIDEHETALFATHRTLGVLDTGATKTVIGSDFVADLLDHLSPDSRRQVKRCRCSITFRFGNQATLESTQALVVPIGKLLLKVAIVPGRTPFLVSNTLIRALKASIDAERDVLISRLLACEVPLKLTSKGLYLIDLNKLIIAGQKHAVVDDRKPNASDPNEVTSTFASEAHEMQTDCPKEKSPKPSQVRQLIDHWENNPKQVPSPSKMLSHKINSSHGSADRRSAMHADAERPKDRIPIGLESQNVARQSPSEDPTPDAETCRARGGSHWMDPEGSPSAGNRLWEHSSGQNLHAGVAGGTRMGVLDHPKVLEEPKDRAYDLHQVCRDDGDRDGEGKSQCRRSQESQSQDASDAQEPDHDQDYSQKADANGQEQGIWKELPTGRRQRPRVGRDQCHAMRDRIRDVTLADYGGECRGAVSHPSGTPGISYAAYGECLAADPQPPQPGKPRDSSTDEHASVRGQAEEPAFLGTEINGEKSRLGKLIQQYENEFAEYQLRNPRKIRKHIALLEVFCAKDSPLTHQTRALGSQAIRHSLDDGDLQTIVGRERLYQVLNQYEPEHVWVSPECGPWSSWMSLNASRSVEHWDRCQHERKIMLEQVALCIVLFRIQQRRQKSFHWEQPARSLMFKLPYLQEVHAVSRVAQCDLCNIGELRDPISQKLMKKGMWIITTSKNMFDTIHGRTCKRDHEHEAIAGSTKLNGKTISRTKFTERYPRKFARTVAKVCIQNRRRAMAENAFTGEAASSSLEPIRVTSQQLPGRRFGQTPTITRSELEPVQFAQKRRRLEGKQTQEAENESAKFIRLVNELVPRVGKREITNPEMLKLVQDLMNDKKIVKVISCRGTDRTIGPPANMLTAEAPFRKAIVILRESGDLKIEKSWEDWSKLSKRQIIRPAHACRANITVFAQNPESPRSTDVSMPESREHEQKPQTQTQSIQSLAQSETEPMPQGTSQTRENLDRTAEDSPDRTAQVKAEHGPRFKNLPKEDQQKLIRAHQNLGHPNNERLSHALKIQGCRSEIVHGVLDMSCSTCQETIKPKHARPSRLHDYCDFNDKISMDGVTWTNKNGKKFHFYHVIDHGTSYHAAIVAPNRSAENMIDCLNQMWLCWAGMPNEIVTDSATEFESEEFQNMLQRNGIMSTMTNPDSHWQMGKIERHGGFVQSMLQKIDMERPIQSYHDVQQALSQCMSAKNCLSQKGGFTPQMLVFGKHPRIPGSIVGDESLPAHCLAEDEQSYHGRRFKEQLELRMLARSAFHKADNDAALRRAMLRRTCPFRGRYENGDQVMCWKAGTGASPGRWYGPMRVLVQDGDHTVWMTMTGNLHRVAPENVRPVSLHEATEQDLGKNAERQERPTIENHDEPQLPTSEETPEMTENPETAETTTSPPERQITTNTEQLSEQPDQEPEIQSNSSEQNHKNAFDAEMTNLVCTCLDEDALTMTNYEDSAWRVEFDSRQTVERLQSNSLEENLCLLATTAKKQRTEVRLSSLTPAERSEFEKAKQTEIKNWLSTGTVMKMLRNQIAPEQILRCRWILTWKPLDPTECTPERTHKAKARLVVLGYLDPAAADSPRDSPTLNKASRMLTLQLIASKGWTLQSFDIKAAFLQGKPSERTIAIDPVPEMRAMMNMKEDEVGKLAKSAYGLMSAPLQWFAALHEELVRLGFQSSPMDPCLYVLRKPGSNEPSGIIGIHVDDGLCGGDEWFQEKLRSLEQKYAFGSYKTTEFTFTGIELKQRGDHSIVLSQEKYVGKIPPIKIDPNRKTLETEKVNEEEKQALRGLIGSLQYAATNTRPDLSAKLSALQSEINKATVGTLLAANRVLHEAKSHKDVSITIKPIALREFCFLAFSDASFASKSKPESHSGAVIVGTNQNIMKNQNCPISPLMWGCHKIQKVVTSTLAAETVSLASALDQLSRLRIFWAWILNDSTKWKEPEKTLESLPAAVSAPTTRNHDIAITDCKSLYDMTTRTAMPSCTEYRTMLLARSIKDMLNENVNLRWVHSGAQLADALTKWMESHFLRETLRIGSYRLCDEESTLKDRANTRNRLKWLRSQEENLYFLGV